MIKKEREEPKKDELLKTARRRYSEIDSNFQHLCVSKDASVLQAMEVIEKGRERTCFVVDENQKLILVVTDGDIRRALLRGCSPSFSVKEIHDRVPIIALHPLELAFG